MKILIADDDKTLRTVLTTEFIAHGYLSSSADNGHRTLELLHHEEYDILILDLAMPGLGGLGVLRKLKDDALPTEVIILTGNATITSAIEAMKLGAYDFLLKPFKLDELKAVIEKAYEKKILRAENIRLKAQILKVTEAKEFVTRNPQMGEILERASKIAQSVLPVLIQGESGVGKELMARIIHQASGRREGPFVPLNCGAIPASMFESELFGHEKGAFTGAHEKKLGLVEIAEGGSLFLDEIVEMPPSLQTKLLRVIETGRFFRVGGTREMAVDVRFIAATNKNLEDEVEGGNFRSDLYFRLGALPVTIPPLRDRKDDIPLLVDQYLAANSSFKGRSFSPEAVRILSEYSWPGNVRELHNVVHRTLLLSPNTLIGPSDISRDLVGTSEKDRMRLEDMEMSHIRKILAQVGGNRGMAAKILGIDPKTLYRKLKRAG